LQFLSLIGCVYKPPEPELELFAQAPPPTAQLPDELLSMPVSSALPTSMYVGDIANFDIGFHISDVDSDTNCDMDTSADMFL